MFASAGEIFSSEENPQRQENGDRNVQLRQLLSNPRLWEKAEITLTHRDIVASVSHFLLNSDRKSEMACEQDFPWLTRTALGGGQGVEVFSLM